jgi:hypothetical protein
LKNRRQIDPAAFTPDQGVSSPLVVGWKEYVDFPAWGIRRVKVKIDTGARTSALGVLSYDLHEEAAGLVAEMQVAPYRKHPERIAIVRAPVLRMVVVSNSGGMREPRPVIEAEIRLGPLTKRISFTITNRTGMLFPAIFGRKALEGHFVVDVGRKYVLKGR